MAPRVERLEPTHDRAEFTCGVAELDRYIRSQAGQDARRRVAAPFVLVMEDGSVGGFYTLSATAVTIEALPDQLARKLPRHPLVPATLLGRLAVDQRLRSRGWGRFLLADAMRRALRSEVASFALIVDAKDEPAMLFYKREGFLSLEGAPNRLFRPMADIARLEREA